MSLPRTILALALFTVVPSLSLAQVPAQADPRLEQLASGVSAERLRELVGKLASFGTRNTLSEQNDPVAAMNELNTVLRDKPDWPGARELRSALSRATATRPAQ